MSTGPTNESDAPSGASPGDEPAAGSEAEMRANEATFPTTPEVSSSSLSSDVRKAQVRAALFQKLEPVRVGRFILLERLGAGSMGEIYAAYDEQLDRRVALKLVLHGSHLAIKADDLLLREAQALAQVSHPNVVQIYEAGTHEGRVFIAMELVRGQTLTRWLGDVAQLPRPHRRREILRQFIAAGRGLEAAHAAGVAHRDFKPDNVLVGEDGRVRVVDFGLARVVIGAPSAPSAPSAADDGPELAGADLAHDQTVRMQRAGRPAEGDAIDPADRAAPAPASRLGRIGEPGEPDAGRREPERPKLKAATPLTKTGTVMGTPRFMAPEQMRGVVADHRSDQFSFCVSLYHALYGAFPFDGEHLEELLDSIETGVIGTEHGGGLAAGLRKALCRGLSVDPSQRFASMGELLAAIEPSGRRRGRWSAAAAVLLGIAVAAYLWPAPPADLCDRAGDGMDAAWSAERQTAVHAALARHDLPYAEAGWQGVKQRLDRYASRWRNEAEAACRATHVEGVQSQQQFDRRMLCLQRGRHQAQALVSELAAGAPDATRGAVEAAELLPDLGACSHTESLMFGLEPPPAAIARDVEAVRAQLARAITLERLGSAEESLAVAREARATTERLKYPAVHAEALVQIAIAIDDRQSGDARVEAQRMYFEALDIAEAERHDQLAAAIWSQLVWLAVRMDAGTQQAHTWWRRDAAAVRRIGNPAYELAQLHHRLGQIYYQDSAYASAADEESRAIAAISALPERQVELSNYYDGLAMALEPQNRLDEAVRMHERALQIAADTLGPSHPDVITRQINLGRTLARQGQLTRARAVLEAALALIPPSHRDSYLSASNLHAYLSEVSYDEGKLDDAVAHGLASLQIGQRAGAPAKRLAEAYTVIGNAELKRENFEDALAMYERARALRQALGADHYQVGVNEGSIAEALVGLARYDQALDHVREAERIFDHGSARERRLWPWILTVHGEVLVGQHRPQDALPILERALSLLDDIRDPSTEAHARWALARALHDLKADPERTRELAERARALFAAQGSAKARIRGTVEQFIERLLLVPEPRSPRSDHKVTR